jgi:hypothetical protein
MGSPGVALDASASDTTTASGTITVGGVKLSGAAADTTSAAGSLTPGGSSSGTAPDAPTSVSAFEDNGIVTALFAPPASWGSGSPQSYQATWSGGQTGQTLIVPIAPPSLTAFNILSARVDVYGVTGGTAGTLTVTATNSDGLTSAASAASNSVTPTSVVNPFKFVPGFMSAQAGDFSFGEFPAIYNVAPGTASSNGTTSNPSGAPTNPVLSSDNVVELDGNFGFQPYFKHVNPNTAEDGRLHLKNYTTLTVHWFPTGENPPALQMSWLKTLWINGTATGSNSGGNSLTDSTQDFASGTLAGSFVINVTATAPTNNSAFTNCTTNTGTVISFDNDLAFNEGDKYEVAVPDIAIGQQVVIGNGSVPSGVTGPATMTRNAWNTWVIDLTAFDAASGTYANVSQQDTLKISMQATSTQPATDVNYTCELELS